MAIFFGRTETKKKDALAEAVPKPLAAEKAAKLIAAPPPCLTLSVADGIPGRIGQIVDRVPHVASGRAGKTLPADAILLWC